MLFLLRAMGNISLLIFLNIGLTLLVIGDAINSPSAIQRCYYRFVNRNPERAATVPNAYGVEQFQSICRNYVPYVNCLTNNLNQSNQEMDIFVELLYQNDSMHIAYAGICRDINVLAANSNCLRVTDDLRRCYVLFGEEVGSIIQRFPAPLDRNQPDRNLREEACNVTVRRYQCELTLYGRCNRNVGRVMANYLYGALPTRCQRQMNVRSDYTREFGTGSILTYSMPTAVSCVLISLNVYLYQPTLLWK